MFNTNNFNYNINAVSGTLRKSHPKSNFTIRKLSSDLSIFDNDNPKLTRGSNEVVVVLQTMLIGDGKALIEYVNKDDFEKSEVADSE